MKILVPKAQSIAQNPDLRFCRGCGLKRLAFTLFVLRENTN